MFYGNFYDTTVRRTGGIAWMDSRECCGIEVEVGMIQENYAHIWSSEQGGN